MSQIELNEYILNRMNLPRRLWFAEPPKDVLLANRDEVKSWLSKWEERGSIRDDYFILGEHANEMMAVMLKAVARRGVMPICFHPNEIEIILQNNPNTKRDWYELPLLGIHSFFEDESYDWDKRSFLYGLIKSRWWQQRPTLLATSASVSRLGDLMKNSECLAGFFNGAKSLNV